MSRELFLARRLLESAADPYAAPSESEHAVSELVAFARRFGEAEKSGYLVRVDDFDRIRVDDLSATAWLLLVENAELSDPVVPDGILEELFQGVADEIVRFRLVSGILGHPRVLHNFEEALTPDSAPVNLAELPDCWPKYHIRQLDELRHVERTLEVSPAELLREFVLYLLQDGSFPARALAATAVAPVEQWREPARQLVQAVVRSVDPELSSYGATFRRARV